MTDLLDLGLRWVHVIAGIMWIGNSLLFNWLDRNLRAPTSGGADAQGDIWLIHSGGFYLVEKTSLAGRPLPVPLHWFKWQAYTTWLSGAALTIEEQGENRAAMRQAWQMHYADVTHSLRGGFYQGWDLHPAQLVTRYAAVYSFFLEGVEAAAARLRNFLAKAAQATLVGDVFDDAATGQGLLNFFLRAINSGALTEAEAGAMIDLTVEELRTRSFTKILRGRG